MADIAAGRLLSPPAGNHTTKISLARFLQVHSHEMPASVSMTAASSSDRDREREPRLSYPSPATLERILASRGDGLWEWSHAPGSMARICVSGGRIAWVHNTDVGVSLSVRLAIALDITLESLQHHVNECRLSGAKLGEYLVNCAIMTALELRRVLAAHNHEHLVALFTGPLPETHHFDPRCERYDAQFTFSVAELLAPRAPGPILPDPAPRLWELGRLQANCPEQFDLDRVMRLDGATGAAIVDLEIGCCLDSRGLAAETVEALALGQASVALAAIDLAESLGGEAQFDELAFTLPGSVQISTPILGTSQLLFVVLDPARTTLGLALHQLTQLTSS